MQLLKDNIYPQISFIDSDGFVGLLINMTLLCSLSGGLYNIISSI